MKLRRALCTLLCMALLLSMFTGVAATTPGRDSYDNYVAPTCTEDGYHWYGGDTWGHEPALGHDWNTKNVIPTCTKDGKKYRKCDRCGLVEESVWPALGHYWAEWVIIRPATETEYGIRERNCHRGDATEREYFDMENNLVDPSSSLSVGAWETGYENGHGYFDVSVGNCGETTIVSWEVGYADAYGNGKSGGFSGSASLAPWDDCSHSDLYGGSISVTPGKEDIERGYMMIEVWASGVDELSRDVYAESCMVTIYIPKNKGGISISADVQGYSNYDSEGYIDCSVTNSGKTKITEWTVWYNDVFGNGFSGTVSGGVLEVGATENTCTIVVPAGKEDFERGYIEVTLYATGRDVSWDGEIDGESNVVSESVTVRIDLPRNKGGISLSAWSEGYADGEGYIGCSVTNTGETKITEWTVWYNDAFFNGFSGTEGGGELEVGVTDYTGTIVVPVCKEDYARGYIEVSLYATGRDVSWDGEIDGESNVVSESVSVVIQLPKPALALSMVQNSEIKPLYADSDYIGWDLTVTNTSDVDMTDIILWVIGNDNAGYIGLTGYLSAGKSYSAKVGDWLDASTTSTGVISFDFTAAGTDAGDRYVCSNTESFSYTLGNVNPTPAKWSAVSVTKEITSTEPEGGYKVDDTISYRIIVTNESTDITVYDLDVYDPLKGSNEDAVLAMSAELAPGENLWANYDHVVTQQEFDSGVLMNQATAAWFEKAAVQEDETGEGDEPTGEDESTDPARCYGYSNVVYVYFTKQKGGLSLNKEVISTPTDGIAYREGEQISYRVTVFNNTGEDLSDGRFVDPLTGDDFPGMLLKGETLTYYTAPYTVTGFDAAVGTVSNYAEFSASGNDREYFAISNTVTVPTTEKERPDMAVLLYEISTPAKGYYEVNDQVDYLAIIMNLSDETLYYVDGWAMRTDAMYGLITSYATSINPHSNIGITFTTTVDEYDVGSIDNVVFADAVTADYAYVSATSNVVTVPVGGNGIAKELGDDYCVKTVEEDIITLHYCDDHYAAMSALYEALEAEGADKAAVYAEIEEAWINEICSVYSMLMRFTDVDTATALLAEQGAFVAMEKSAKAALAVSEGEEKALEIICGMLADKCVSLCYELHTAPEDRSDSYISASYKAQTGEACDGSRIFAQDIQYNKTMCEVHAAQLTVTENTVNAATAPEVRKLMLDVQEAVWMRMLNTRVSAAIAAAESKAEFTAAATTFSTYVGLRKKTLERLYPHSAITAEETFVNELIDRVTDMD